MFKTKEKIRFHDSDPAGILFYGNIFKLVHSACEDMISSFSMNLNYYADEKFVFPLVHAEADYIKPIRTGDNVEIEIGVYILGETSFTLEYVITNNADEILANVKTVHVCVSKENFKKSLLPEELRNNLELHKI
ncbi:MAG: acyl-CoA thioesterase [Melioribacteraceae bacterium]|nr:acyl-CoA thioesterase [Melioribacteraceae bacterium]